jgi:hypothetical protein
MQGLNELPTKNKTVYILACIAILLIAFFQCYRVSHDLNWSYDVDIHRDMSYVQGNLYGHFGQDPNFPGAYLWYNPLLTLAETAIVKVTGLPVHVVLTRAGVYLNLLGPIAFIFMMLVLTDFKITLASLVSYLFLASGAIPSYYAATYSPWLYPVCYAQFLFYLNIVLCYKAFSTQKYFWFFIQGSFIGISFLAHTAPTILIILILASLQLRNLINAVKQKDYASVKKFIAQGIITFIPFVVASLPLTYYIVGKYHMHFLNRMPFEYVDGMFILHNFPEMIRQNISVAFIISLIGFVWFYKNFHHLLIRKIIMNWLFISVIMYIYSTAVATADNQFNFHLPGTVPSFHYFYYIKALQSVFFGFGFVFLISPLIKWIERLVINKSRKTGEGNYAELIFIVSVLLCTIIYFPFYQKRYDFVFFREQNLIKEKDKDGIEAYNYILQHIPEDKVVLCEEKTSIFPVLPTARKMVSIGITFSNPYLDFNSRESDRNHMIAYLRTGQPQQTRALFDAYNVSFVLLKNLGEANDKTAESLPSHIVFKNNTYTIYKIDR